MISSPRSRLFKDSALFACVGLSGFLINCLPLKLFPNVYLLFGSSLVIALASRRGPLSGGLAGLMSGSRTWLLWNQPFPISALLLCGEGIWVGFICRRKGWRPLYATISYWLLAGCWINVLVQVFLFNKGLVSAGMIGLRSILNGLVNSLLAELFLIGFAYIQYRRNRNEDGFRLGLSSTVGLLLVLAIGFTAIFGVAAKSHAERAKAYAEMEIDGRTGAEAAARDISTRLTDTSRSVEYVADLIRIEDIPLTRTEQLTRLLDALRMRHEQLSGLYIADSNARSVAFSLTGVSDVSSLIGKDYSSSPYFRELMETKRPVHSSVFERHDDRTTASIAVPLFARDGTVRGFVAGWYASGIFKEIASRISSEHAGSTVLITDSQGQVIADSSVSKNDGGIRSIAGHDAYSLTTRSSFGSGLKRSNTPFNQLSRNTPAESGPAWVSWATVPDVGWKVIVLHPLLPVEAALLQQNLEQLEILLVFVLLAIVVSNAIGDRLTEPLVELESYALQLASGDLAARPGTTFVITHEANLLRRAFSKMASALEQSWREQQAVTKNAEIVARDAQERAGHVAALNSLGQELSLTFDLSSICRAAHRYIQTQVEVSGFLISLFDEPNQLIKPTYAWGGGNEYDESLLPVIPLGDGAHSQCIRTKSPVLVEDIKGTQPFKTAVFVGGDEDERWPQSFLYLPLISFDRIVGTFQVQSYSTAQFQTEDIDRLIAVANQIAVSINNAMLFEQIKHAKIEWEKTFDSMSDGVFLFDEKATLIRANRAGANMEGIEIQSLVGKHCCDILASASNQECFVDAAIRNGDRVVKEIVTRRNDRTLLLTVEPVDVNGLARGSICVARDITELRRAEEEARSQREFLAQLVESAQEAIFTFNKLGRITWFNQRFAETTGYSSELTEDFDVRLLLDAEDVAAVEECVGQVFEGANEACEARFVRRDGEVRWFKTTLTPVRSHGSITSVLAVTRDVTDERMAAEQMQRANKLAAVGQLAAGVAHDFNNLLVPILGRAQLLKRQLKDANATRGLEVIEKAALDGAATVRRLQNFSRRRGEDQLEPVEVDELLRDVVELTRTRWRDDAMARGVKYEISLNFGEGLVVMGSPSELREVFTNIIINALDAMPDGGRLALRSQVDNSNVRVTISDSGPGMSDEVRARIFEPFFSTKGHSGNGLGLAVSYGIIQRHGGSIRVDSALGLGCTFTIILPLSRSESARPLAENPVARKMARVLVVDDEESVRLTLMEILIDIGYEVISVSGGKEGLQRLAEAHFDLVMTDLSMPEMDGWTFARHIRERFPDMKTVLVTGYGATVETTAETASLVDAVIAKPYDYSEIARIVEKFLGQELPCEVV